MIITLSRRRWAGGRPSRFVLALSVIVSAAFLSGGRIARADFTFVHITDTHVGAGDNAQKDAVLFREIAALSPKPSFVMNTGDVVEAGTPAEYAAYRAARDGNLGSVRAYAAPGNHDVRWNPKGKEGFTTETGQPLYQSWDKENVHFVLLDSTVVLQHWGHFDQAQLSWLSRDLKKAGQRKPVVIGFHHWVGRETRQIDNESAFLDVIRPYNVKLLLIGHGHSDITWNVNGIPAVMNKGLYQGSYSVVRVSRDRITVTRHTEKTIPAETTKGDVSETIVAAPPPTVVETVEAVSTNLKIHPLPRWTANIAVANGEASINVPLGSLPRDSGVSCRIGEDKEEFALSVTDTGWSGAFSASRLASGVTPVAVHLTLPDKNVYTLYVSVRTEGASIVAPAWAVNVGSEVQGKLAQDGGTLYVPTMGGAMIALDAKTGANKWTYQTGGAVFSASLIAGNTVYFGSGDHNVYAVDAASGALRWKTTTDGAVFAGAAKAKDTICIGSTDTNIYGLDATSGAVKWRVKGDGMFQSQAVTDGEKFYVGGWDNTFRAIDAQTGAEAWKNKFGKSFYYSPAIGSPTVGGDLVYVSSNDGVLHAMNRADGKIIWEVPGPALGYSGPLYRDGKIYNASLTDTGRVFRFNAQTGAKEWETATGSVIYDSSCTESGGSVFVGSVNGTFSALSAQSGVLRWQYRLAPGHLLASPVADTERVYIATLSGDVVAFPVSGARGSAVVPAAASVSAPPAPIVVRGE